MEVMLASEMGFCFGVRRAVELACRAAGRGQVCTLGPLVHNARVVRHLEAQGIRVANALADIESGTVVIASHGASPAVTREAGAAGLTVVDATCPMVRAIQKEAQDLAREGFLVVVFGDPHHAEVQGIVGWGQDKTIVVSSVEELAALPPAKRIALLAQSTQNAPAYRELATKLVAGHLNSTTEIRVLNTICDATARRQSAAAALAGQVDVIIVVGGRDSANTRRLAEICMQEGAIAHQVEGDEEIDPAWLHTCRKAGVTAGASTPDWVINEVIETLRRIGGPGCVE